ncbi:cation:proton antiporter [Candidatus Uhrbacteria bacterium]|nr:cation:proton antiporter [Candidatus Uhrbacteria bacterium]
MGETYFVELGIITIVAVAIVGLMRFLRQPLIIGYILTGVILGPYFLDVARSTETIAIFSKLGVAFLLFVVGLELNPRVIKSVGKVSLLTGIGQIVFTSAIGYLIGRALGFVPLTSLYIAVALTFSSTIIIMKLLSDKGDLEKLYGKIAVGFLIVQDLVAMFILMAVSAAAVQSPRDLPLTATLTLGLILIATLILFSIYLLPPIITRVARSSEFLFLFALGWSLAIASLFHALNFSIEIGALTAGVALSLSPYRYEISARMQSLRDFFIVLFFVLLGSQMVFADVYTYLIPALIFSLFVLIGNPIIVVALMGALGYTKRNSFRAGLTVAQISEFSIILVGVGVANGQLDSAILSFITLVGLITIAGSSYLIIYEDKIFPRLAPLLSIFERKGKKIDRDETPAGLNFEAILFGYNRIGFDILAALQKTKINTLVVDYNPDVIYALTKDGIPCVYGDITDPEFLNTLSLRNAKICISTIPALATNAVLLNELQLKNPRAIILMTAHQIDDARALYARGASYVIMPHFLGGAHVAQLILNLKLSRPKFLARRKAHLANLAARLRAGHEHPMHQREK